MASTDVNVPKEYVHHHGLLGAGIGRTHREIKSCFGCEHGWQFLAPGSIGPCCGGEVFVVSWSLHRRGYDGSRRSVAPEHGLGKGMVWRAESMSCCKRCLGDTMHMENRFLLRHTEAIPSYAACMHLIGLLRCPLQHHMRAEGLTEEVQLFVVLVAGGNAPEEASTGLGHGVMPKCTRLQEAARFSLNASAVCHTGLWLEKSCCALVYSAASLRTGLGSLRCSILQQVMSLNV